jgi:hypothetical protein
VNQHYLTLRANAVTRRIQHHGLPMTRETWRREYGYERAFIRQFQTAHADVIARVHDAPPPDVPRLTVVEHLRALLIECLDDEDDPGTTRRLVRAAMNAKTIREIRDVYWRAYFEHDMWIDHLEFVHECRVTGRNVKLGGAL